MSLSVTLSCHQLLFPVSYGSSSLAGHYHQRRAFVFQRSNNATACVLFFPFFAETARRSFKILIQAKNKQPSCRSTKNKEDKKKTKTKKKTNDL